MELELLISSNVPEEVVGDPSRLRQVLNFTEAALKLEETELIIEEGGNHSFEGIERYFRKINSFFYN